MSGTRGYQKLLTALLIVFIAFTYTYTRSSALSEQLFITVKINGQPIYVDTNPYIRNNRTFVPIRFIAEAFQLKVEWIQAEKKTILRDETTTIEMWIDSNKLVVNGEELSMDVNVEGIDGRTMVPIRYFAESLNFSVHWDDTTCSVALFKENAEIPESSILKRSYTDEDLLWLARIVHVEGRNTSLESQVAIANVVLNRTKEPDFPDTIYDVIFDKRHSVQFPPAHKDGFTELVPDKSCVIAAKMALEGINNIDECLYFNQKPFKSKSDDLFKVIDGEYFYY